MKKIVLGLMAWALTALAVAGPNSIVLTQRNAADTGNIFRTLNNPATDGIVIFNTATKLPDYLTIGAGLSVTSGVLSAVPTGPAPVNADWNATSGLARILNKPTISTVGMTGQAADLTGLAQVALTANYGDLNGRPVLATVGISGLYSDLIGRPNLFSGAYADLTGKPTLFSGSYNDLTNRPTFAPVAFSGDYNALVNKPAPVAYTFDYGQPVARTLALSTAYQATNTAKAADVTVSPSCTAALTLTGGSTCSLQARVGPAPLSCSTGTVVATWTNGNTGALSVGLALNQTVGAPYAIKLPIGASFILCPTSGTFTVTAAEQTAG